MTDYKLNLEKDLTCLGLMYKTGSVLTSGDRIGNYMGGSVCIKMA